MMAIVVYSVFRRRIIFIIMNRILTVIVFLIAVLSANEFNEGPYGSGYFDIAGPFTLVDLNLELGDVNTDNIVNIFNRPIQIWFFGKQSL